MYQKTNHIPVCVLVLILVTIPALTFAGNTNSSPPDTTETQSLMEVIVKDTDTSVKGADLSLLDWEFFDGQKYTKEKILSGSAKGSPHPFNLNHDTVDVQNLPSVAWLRTNFLVPDSLRNKKVYLSFEVLGAAEFYWNGTLFEKYGDIDPTSENDQLTAADIQFISLQFSSDSLQQLSFRLDTDNIKVDQNALLSYGDTGVSTPEIFFSWNDVTQLKNNDLIDRALQSMVWILGLCLMIIALLKLGLAGTTKVNINEFIIGFLFFAFGLVASLDFTTIFGYYFVVSTYPVGVIALILLFFVIPNHVAFKANSFSRRQLIYNGVPFLLIFSLIIFYSFSIHIHLAYLDIIYLTTFVSVLLLHIGEAIITSYKQYKAGKIEFIALLIGILLMVIGIGGGFSSNLIDYPQIIYRAFGFIFVLSVPFALLLMPIIEVFYTNRELQQTLEENERLHKSKLETEQEKKKLLENRKEELEKEVQARTSELEEAYEDLQDSLNELESTQEQLVQQEKLASLGQLTAGIAHEIKNPLNFVNNFSDLSVELVEETREEIKTSESSNQDSEVLDLLDDIEMNLEKINEHGNRADGIVKSMLQHSRGGDGEMEPTDLNGLVEEYVNLSFHGMRASEHPINVDIEMDLDEDVGEIPLIAEDFSRVIINLCNNAFDAMRKKQNAGDGMQEAGEYEPNLTVRTYQDDGQVIIEVEDNGPGIPEEVRDEIMQPFFTTKEGTEGTGLGLSITNDIIKAHGGSLKIKTREGVGSIFSVLL